jgi:DNA mismatch endonuclease (patch repair protein)
MEKLLRATLVGGVFGGVSRTRSLIMGSIRGSNNRSTELALRMALIRAGVSGWKLHPRLILGRPDFHFEKGRVLVFVDGCFWHGCPNCMHPVKTRPGYWGTKIVLNKKRDRKTTKALCSSGFLVLRFWEHEINHAPAECVRKIVALLSATDREPNR